MKCRCGKTMALASLTQHIEFGVSSTSKKYVCECGISEVIEEAKDVKITTDLPTVPLPPIQNETSIRIAAIERAATNRSMQPAKPQKAPHQEAERCDVCGANKVELFKTHIISGCCGQPIYSLDVYMCGGCKNKTKTINFQSERGEEIFKSLMLTASESVKAQYAKMIKGRSE